jgi:UDP-glucose 4-epimerase
VQTLAANSAFALTSAGRRQRDLPRGVLMAVVDWADKTSIADLCRGQDAVVHLAAMNEPEAEKDPEGALRSNGLSTLNLARAAETCGVRRFIYMSTAKVFGSNPTGVIDELSLPRPASHYAITHRLAEDYVLAAHDKQRLEGVVMRLTTCVGAPADRNADAWMLIANDLCRQAVTSRRIELKSSGLAWRNVIAMADVVAALRHMLTVPAMAIEDGLFNLGGLQSLRILDLALFIKARAENMLGGSVILVSADTRTGEQHGMLEWRVSKLMATGWKPNSSLDGEIDATLRMCKGSTPAKVV